MKLVIFHSKIIMKLFFKLLLPFVIWSTHSNANTILNASTLAEELDLSGIAKIYDKADAKDKTINEAINLSDSEFLPFNPQKKRRDSWLKLEVYNDTDKVLQKALYMKENSFHTVDFHYYKYRDSKLVNTWHARSGSHILPSLREFATSIPISSFSIEPNETVKIYIKNDIRKNGIFSFKIGSNYNALKAAFKEVIIIYFYIGLVFSLILYQLFLFFSFKDLGHLIYFGFGLSMIIVIYIGGGQASLHLNGKIDINTWFSAARTASALFVMALPMSIFNSKKLLPKFHKVGITLISIFSALIVFTLIFKPDSAGKIGNIATLAAIPFCLSLGIFTVKLRLVASKIFLFAWTIFLSGVVIWMLKNAGVIPVSFLTRHSALIASGIEIILVGYAVAVKVKHLDNERVIALGKASQLEETKRLVKILCHDISNPLSIMQSSADSIRHNDNEKAWSWITKSLSLIVDIIEHVRKMEALKAGKMKLKLEPVSLGDIKNEIEFVFQNKLSEKDIKLKFENFDKANYILAHRTTVVHDVFANFISNSIKFSEKGSLIFVSAKYIDDKIQVKIRDTGIGMPQSILDSLFDSSKATSRPGTNREKGTGFGMPLAKGFMDQYQGEILIKSIDHLEDPENSGTTTHLTFKAAESN